MQTEREYVESFGLDKIVEYGIFPEEGINDAVDPNYKQPFRPEWPDLVRLHKLVLDRRVTTVLEFGCGFSTTIFAHAMAINKSRHADFITNTLRRNNAFEVHSVDDMPDYIAQTMERVPAELRQVVHMHTSSVRMCLFNDRIATEYTSIPNICPDLIYLDGPSQHSAQGDINGISTAHRDRLPMSCDILRMEHFLLPGTMIVVDGRTANARFLECNLQRGWVSLFDPEADITMFELQEPPLGIYNKRQIGYCLGGNYQLAPTRP